MVRAEVRVERCTGRRPLETGVLRAYLDQELAPARQQAVAGHVASCAACAASVARLETTARLVARRFGGLDAPGVGAPVPAMSAALLATLDRAWRPGKGLAGRLGSGWSGLLERLLWPAPHRRPLVRLAMGAAVLALALAAAFAQPAVRSTADAVVQRFRVQRFQAVQVDLPELAAQIEQLRPVALPSPGDLGTFSASGEPRLRTATTKEDAARRAGMPVRMLSRLPARVPNQPVLFVSEPVQFNFTYDGTRAAEAARAAGVRDQALLSNLAALHGVTVRGDVPAAVVALYGELGLGQGQGARGKGPGSDAATRRRGDAAIGLPAPNAERRTPNADAAQPPALSPQPPFLVVVQLRSPSIELPAGVNVDALREQLLRAAPLPQGLTAQLLGIADWRTTLPMPLTVGTAREVTVDGTTALLVTGEYPGSRLVWQRDGILYAIIGADPDSEAAVLQAARSLR